jgi:hypothetical protein
VKYTVDQGYGWFMVFYATFKKYFSYIVAVSFIGGGNWSTRRKPPTCHKPLTIYHIILYLVYFAMNGVRTHNLEGFREDTYAI